MTPAATLAGAEASARAFGGQSMTAHLRAVLVRRPAPPASEVDWRRFGYLHPVDHRRSELEHAAFCARLTEAGAEVIAVGPDPAGELDAVFAFDPSIITDRGAIICRLGKAERAGEADLAARSYAELGIPILGRIEAPGTLEGGDTFWLDEQTLAVGLSYRTNQDGLDQLARILAGIGVAVVSVALPHWRGAGECLHLMSLVSPVAPDLAVVYPPLLPVPFLQHLRARGWRFVEVPEEEFDSMGCNVLALAPGRCLMLAGNPTTQGRLAATGCEVVTYEGEEISLNRAGGPTCLTKPLWRAE